MYRVKGADQREYGPISTEQVRLWISENRLNRYTLASTEENPAWRPLSQFAEFADLISAQPAAVSNIPASANIPPATPNNISDASIGAAVPAVTREAALSLVAGPAISLIVLGSLGIVYCLLSIPKLLLQNWTDMPIPPGIPPEMEPQFRMVIDFMKNYGKSYGIVFYSLIAVLHGLVLFGGIQMKRLQGLALCWVASVLAIICYGCCCCISIPFSVWAMVTLTKPGVKAHFR